ncbi:MULTISPECIES: phytanoyl-CoA dioxygenase family protein [unclassified Ensifer]|uniref:phytanoyl-CoA dioxygenase family protein n=1 Tax=unclassified Ensifer TaxID=2633371 RepID=UPI000812D39E|nr:MULTISPECIES: phytanoyl-CoA dioxygenase family protein [unclassified Ensifer]OCP10274.1 phytanoyl-CoA dioxygenase [Ensifer sp. LC13]OCP11268.1 phytanoyl-CoA dioxygenase [Ensifer sp. LC11]OCP14657.1 phytanoyl-CoA dioxygenase [Ensifer sp. LC14]OCP33232.1 phytanoyl-CoA dioxygenase [Ensifer sp. LC499]
MKGDNSAGRRIERVWLTQDACDIEAFRAEVERRTDLSDYPYAKGCEKNVLIYDSADLIAASSDAEDRRAVLAEICEVLATGPGVAVFKGAFADRTAIDVASGVFDAIIEEQHRTNSGGGDHFAKPGANDRIWNSLEKHCLKAPENFAAYYGNAIIALVSEAWLGPNYQMTAQVNRVNPGGAAQSAHRDYHLGFQTSAVIEQYPVHVHRLSPVLTLQGAVAHCDMPLESGPTLFLPYSQTYVLGYLALNRPEFRAYFDEHHVQLPLAKGDVVFFNPALFHAAGTNRSADIRRVANLLQVSSAFGRAMETVDRLTMSATLYPALKTLLADGKLTAAEAANAIASCAEGYSFPTNLDRDPPLGGLAPKTQAQLMREALAKGMSAVDLHAALKEQARRKLS